MALTSTSTRPAAVSVAHLLLHCAVILLQLCAICSGARLKHLANGGRKGAKAPPTNVTHRVPPAGATWYGPPDGAGSTGGACGYGAAVAKAPFSSLVAAGGPSLFLAGRGCGACYQVWCTENDACSGKPVTVVITDECPGGPCFTEPFHFDLSGKAISAMAKPGFADPLRAVGILPVQFSRVPCNYPGRNVAFRVDVGSNPNYFAVLIEFEDGDGELSGVALKELGYSPASPAGKHDNGGNEWRDMVESWGAIWRLNSGPELRPPFSIRLTSGNPGRTLVANDVIPAGWKPGATYRSLVNFE